MLQAEVSSEEWNHPNIGFRTESLTKFENALRKHDFALPLSPARYRFSESLTWWGANKCMFNIQIRIYTIRF